MNVRRAQVAIRHRWLVLALLAVVAPIVGAIVATTAPVHYRATAVVLISSEHIGSIDDLAAGSQLAVNIAHSFVPVVTSAAVLSPVIEKLHLAAAPDQLARQLRVTLPLLSSTVTISGTSDTQVQAAAFVNAVADQFALLVPKLSPTLGASPAFEATKIEPAYPPASDAGLRLAAGLSIGLLGALLVGWAIIALYDADPIVESRAAIARVTRVPVVGVIPHLENASAAGEGQASGVAAATEAYRVTRAAIEVVAPDIQVLMVVSSQSGEGRATAATRLAASAAEASRRVLLVDADLRHAQLGESLHVANFPGLREILHDDALVSDVAQPHGGHGLHVVAGGGPISHAAMSGPAVGRFLTTTRAAYDLVVIDVAALDATSDALGLASQVDGVLIVVHARKTRQRLLHRSIEDIAMSGGSIVGIVLIDVPASGRRNLTLLRDHGVRELVGI